jgi:hypothetical protein
MATPAARNPSPRFFRRWLISWKVVSDGPAEKTAVSCFARPTPSRAVYLSVFYGGLGLGPARKPAPRFEALRAQLKKARCRVTALDEAIADESGDTGGRGPKQADILIELAQSAELSHTPDGIENPPVRFRRAAGMQPLPAPVAGGSIGALRSFLNVQSENDFVLVVAWALAVLRNRGPYPVIVLSGEQGSAKSTFSAILRALLDPNTWPAGGFWSAYCGNTATRRWKA